jgi:protein-S-isoprenylcysteine O-methyltransferase Ste14
MFYIVLGIVGFGFIHIFDFVALKKVPILKPVTWITGSVLLIYSAVVIFLHPDKITLPLWMPIVGWLLLGFSLYLLIHSLFLNLPFKRTYMDTGVGDKLVKTGLYSLVRHPGVLWFGLLMLGLLLASRSQLYLVAGPVWLAIDVFLVWIQDRYIFGRMFIDYDQYQKETPMLLPTRKSIDSFINELKLKVRT